MVDIKGKERNRVAGTYRQGQDGYLRVANVVIPTRLLGSGAPLGKFRRAEKEQGLTNLQPCSSCRPRQIEVSNIQGMASSIESHDTDLRCIGLEDVEEAGRAESQSITAKGRSYSTKLTPFHSKLRRLRRTYPTTPDVCIASK